LNLNTTNISELSYGQKKKFYIAFGLATNAKLILMDEPTNGLDIPSKGQFRLMVDSAINDKCCIVISTHQVLDLDNLINNIIIMNEHEIIFNESTENITKKLLFKIAENHDFDESVIYSQDTLRGYYQVCENKTGEASRLDVELLFNAVISDHHRIKELFH
jgi:ABC-2 type transport system ATP-binding protein